MPIPCSQFVRRVAALLPMPVMLVMALATPVAAQSTNTPPPSKVTPLFGGTVIPQVTPHGASVTASVGANSYVFTVKNVGTGAGIMTSSPTCSGVASACAASPTSFSLNPGASRTVTVNYTGSSAGGSGTVTLEVDDQSGTHYDIGYVTVTVPPPPPTYNVSVTPDGAAYSMAAGTSSYNFTVANTGTGDATYTLASSCGGMVSGCSAPASVYVPHGTSAPVGVSFSDGTPGTTGTVSLTASYGGYSDGGSLNVSVNNSYAVSVTPDNQSQVVSPSSYVTFFVQNLGSIQTSFNVSVNCGGCSLSASTLTVNPGPASGKQDTVRLNGYAGTVVLTASDPAHGTSDTGSIIVSAPTYTVGVGPDGTPDYWYEAGQAGTANFSVSNSGNSQATYSLSGSCDAVATGCSQPPPSVTVNPSPAPPASVPITFIAGAAGSSGYVRLNASGPSSDGGTVHVLVYSHAVTVAKGATATVYSASGLTLQIGVTNTGNVPNSYNLTASCSGAVSGCTAPASISNLAVGATQQVTVTYTAANAGGSGIVQLVARNTVNTAIADSGTVNVTVKPKYTVAVSPDGGAAQADAWTTASVPFVVTNNGTASGHYTLSVTTCGGTAVRGSCTLDSTSVFVAVGVPKQVNVSFPTGAPTETATIAVLAKSIEDTTFTDPGSVGFTVTKYAVSVTPDSLAVAPAAYASDTRAFLVTNTGTTPRTFRLQVACAPPAATACSASSDIVTLTANNGSVGVNVSYTAGDPGATGTVRLVATDTLGRSADGGSLAVTVGANVAVNKVFVNEVNPGTTIERSACLVFSIVPDVADECGALRIVHPLPAVRTLGKARVPTLMYSSDQVQGPTLAVNVILADTTTIPQSVQLLVSRTVPSARRDSVSFPGSDWQVNRRRRIAMPIVTTGSTGILPYTVEVHLQYAGSAPLAAPPVSGELAVVDRSSSYFGGGWWLAGLEQLFPGQYDGSVLWVAGDGSTRKYVTQHTTSGTDTVYLAPALDRPDTLLHRADGKYQRQAGDGLFVEFSGLGLHQRTVNRLGYATVFTYDGNNHLSTIQLPPLQAGGGPAFTYTFAYNATSGMLDTVTAPPVNGTRKIALARNGATSRVEKITELLSGSTYTVAFDTLPGLLYGARLNRRGVRTTIAYEAGLPTVARFNTPTGTGTGTDTITVEHTFRTAGSLGTASVSVPLDSVYVRYDGPRPLPDVDVTKFWLDRFSAPTRIVNALNQEARITRGDPRFPGLATETRGPYPKYFTTWASYDARGNVLTSTQVNPHGDAIEIDATTTYRWDPKWDMPTQIIQPEGDVTNIGYDAATGNRVSQDDGRGATSRIIFQYYATTDPTTGAMAKLLSGVVLPQAGALISASTKVQYDILGNVDTTWTPGAAWTATTNDAIGRTVATASRIYADSASDTLHVVRTRTDYDGQDRVLTSVNTGPATNGDMQRTITVQNSYNPEGQLEHTVRTQTPDETITILGTSYPGLGGLVSRWRYDNLGRKIAELAPAPDTLHSLVDSTFYDRAGNVTSVLLRRHDGITNQQYRISMTYDALNRLKMRTVPAAGYCARWEGLPRDNPSSGSQPPYPQYPSPNNTCVVPGQDTIAYMPFFKTSGGYTVSSDVASFDYDEMGNTTIADNNDARVRRSYYPNGQMRYDSLYTRTVNRDTVHKYGIEYLYDRNGRVQTLKHPSELAGGAPGYQTGMRYDPITGALTTVINPLSSTYTYSYDERGQLSGIAMPQGVTEIYRYDQDGDVTRHSTAAGTVSFHDDTLSYDLLGKMTHLANGVAGRDTIDTYYTGLGQLYYQNQITHLKGNPITTRYVSTELFSNDAMGNRRGVTTQSSTAYQGGGFPGYTFVQRQSAYERGTGRLLVGQNPGVYRDTTEYDEAGNVVFTTQLRPDTLESLKADRASFYGADGKLRAVDYRTTLDGIGHYQNDFEEYRYDALGRRVLVRARRSCYFSAACGWSYVRRTVWAGAQELYEIQMPDDSVTTTSSGQVLRENDTDALPHLPLTYLSSDPNTFYGRVAYTYGLATDQPLGITRLGYADNTGAWTQPFTIVPLWTMRGYADTSYFAETGTTNCQGNRCVGVSYPAEYWMPAFRMGFMPSAFHGTLMMDKADASGQLFRRNRYYDPATGRFTQEDPIGLAGGINVYGFASGDPVNFSDPLGLCPLDQGALAALICNSIQAATTAIGSVIGFVGGGGAGAVAAAPTAELASPITVPAGAISGAAAGAGAGLVAGQAITSVLFSKDAGDFRGGKKGTRDADHERLMKEFKPDRRQQTRIHEEIAKQKRGRSNLDFDELLDIFISIVGKSP